MDDESPTAPKFAPGTAQTTEPGLSYSICSQWPAMTMCKSTIWWLFPQQEHLFSCNLCATRRNGASRTTSCRNGPFYIVLHLFLWVPSTFSSKILYFYSRHCLISNLIRMRWRQEKAKKMKSDTVNLLFSKPSLIVPRRWILPFIVCKFFSLERIFPSIFSLLEMKQRESSFTELQVLLFWWSQYNPKPRRRSSHQGDSL